MLMAEPVSMVLLLLCAYARRGLQVPSATGKSYLRSRQAQDLSISELNFIYMYRQRLHEMLKLFCLVSGGYRLDILGL